MFLKGTIKSVSGRTSGHGFKYDILIHAILDVAQVEQLIGEDAAAAIKLDKFEKIEIRAMILSCIEPLGGIVIHSDPGSQMLFDCTVPSVVLSRAGEQFSARLTIRGNSPDSLVYLKGLAVQLEPADDVDYASPTKDEEDEELT